MVISVIGFVLILLLSGFHRLYRLHAARRSARATAPETIVDHGEGTNWKAPAPTPAGTARCDALNDAPSSTYAAAHMQFPYRHPGMMSGAPYPMGIMRPLHGAGFVQPLPVIRAPPGAASPFGPALNTVSLPVRMTTYRPRPAAPEVAAPNPTV